MRTYQTVVVIDSLLKSEEIEATIEKILRIINNNGGKVLNVDRWEKRRLAYEIRKRQYGYYVEIIFEAPSNLVKILERDYRLDENILRYLTVTLSKKALTYLDQIKMAKQVPEEKEIPELEELIETEELDEAEEEPVELATETNVE
ncbi:MAG: 30S ribosomal protein S6 [candidate division KSB1 bacterium]|nr:30S ribosomal protein S6 [candidate division KSB1 bacterium]MDZ7335882.1 30S ribosomal protein S6 [candidate division KSB1 bacterium]MDZ7356678.1 30S ribosomal protein S6 [candidate division KSB1 bacterium]MDZ7377090.1 30S ribosomal protein S6 [candidate division KSB1 bacterium]MDZ7398555.1 30S ribosomal protein S6 [candidate division KSB1 bacterium]